jgi:hypothetical protein
MGDDYNTPVTSLAYPVIVRPILSQVSFFFSLFFFCNKIL